MDTKEFFKMCDKTLSDGNVLSGVNTMKAFSDVPDEMTPIDKIGVNEVSDAKLEYASKDLDNEIDDFDDDFDDFEDRLSDSTVTPNNDQDDFDDFDDDFEDFNESTDNNNSEPIASSNNKEVVTQNTSIGIQSMTIATDDAGDSEIALTFEDEIISFLAQHGASTKEGKITKMWNSLYNDSIVSERLVYEKYLKLHYGLWFSELVVMDSAIANGSDFLKALQFRQRVIDKNDITLLSNVWKEKWFDSSILSEFAIDSSYDSVLLSLMKNGDVDKNLLRKYVNDRINLLCCIRLLVADKFILGEFESAIERGVIEQYTNELLQDDGDRFECLKGRSDYNRIVNFILNLERNGGVVDKEILKNYCDAVYLQAIVVASSEGRLDTEFANNYLRKDLGNMAFIADLYEKNEVDTSHDSSNFVFSKLMTDAINLDLDTTFLIEHRQDRGLVCLVCSRFVGSLPEIDYKKFLAVITLGIEHTMNYLNQCDSLIASYNKFYLNKMSDELGIIAPFELSVGDNILYIDVMPDGRKRKYYLQLEDFVLNHDKFMQLINGSVMMTAFQDMSGTLICNQFISNTTRFTLDVNSSLTTWANGVVSSGTMEQFKSVSPVVHSNFLLAIEKVNNKINEDPSRFPNNLISASILEFTKMDLNEYYLYDKMFGFIAERPEFYGLLTATNAFSYLKLFSNTCIYGSTPKIMFMFLYLLIHKYCNGKTEIDSTGFYDLNSEKSIMLIDGMGLQSVCLNFRNVINSIDNLVASIEKAAATVLRISKETVYLKIN